MRSEFILKILRLWCKKFAFIQPDGVSITLQREDLGNELLNIYARHFGFAKKKKKKILRKTENIFFRLLNLGEFLS